MGGWRPRILLLSEPQRGLPDSATGHRDHTEGPPVRQAVLLLSGAGRGGNGRSGQFEAKVAESETHRGP